MKDFAGKGTMRRRRGKSERSIRQKSDAPMDLAAYERCIESQVLKQGLVCQTREKQSSWKHNKLRSCLSHVPLSPHRISATGVPSDGQWELWEREQLETTSDMAPRHYRISTARPNRGDAAPQSQATSPGEL
jgi:hypothetical protein